MEPEPKIIAFLCNGLTYVGAVFGRTDDVLIDRCHSDDYHHLNGNYQVQRRRTTLKEILKRVGMAVDRCWLGGEL